MALLEQKIVLMGKTERKRQLGRPRCRWAVIEMSLNEIRWEGVHWIDFRQEQMADCCKGGNENSKSNYGNFLTS